MSVSWGVGLTGLIADATGFEVVAGGARIGDRREIGSGDAQLLANLAARYARAVQAGPAAGFLLGLGRELHGWLDGHCGQLTRLLEQRARPLVFEVQSPCAPSEAVWALLQAPWELLAPPSGGFLAEDPLIGLSVIRRLGSRGRPPPLDGLRLGLAFMAASPRGQHELDYEAEESAILTAVGETRLDLLVDDSGDPEQLWRAAGMPLVHLSCHGHNSWPVSPGSAPEPVLMVEDQTGEELPVTAGGLVGLLPPGIRLLFLSACLTATASETAGLVAHSLATALVTAGVPAVLGWDGSVSDRAATMFAGLFYRSLAAGESAELAAGDARRSLLASDDPVIRGDWHLARLWFGPVGGGPVATANGRRRSQITATHGTKVFLAGKREVPVAAPQMFVGRRRELQQALRALRGGEKAGVLLRGQGRLGKSSLAARITDRSPDYDVAVVFSDYSALAVLNAIREAIRTNPAGQALIEARLPEVRQRPEALGVVLTDLLSRPCRQRPVLLILDDLEQLLVPNADGPRTVGPAHSPVITAVLRAFDPARSDSRLVVTSRYTFTLSGLETRLEDVQLAPLSPVAQAKLHRRQLALAPAGLQFDCAGLAARAVAVSRGNPGLQDLAVSRLVYGEQVDLMRAEAAIAGIEDYLSQGGLPADAEVREFLESLALDDLLAEAGAPNIGLLRAATLFDLPVPVAVIQALSDQVGGSLARLLGLGLLDPHPDLCDSTRPALAASPLAAGRIDPLTESERASLAATALQPLLVSWGGTASDLGDGWTMDLLTRTALQLTRLSLTADDPAVTATCAAGAVAALRAGPAGVAMELGQDAIALLDHCRYPVPLQLLRAAADAALTSGDGEAGQALLARAVQQAEAGDSEADPLDRARVMAEQAAHLRMRGDLDQAQQLFEHARELFTAGGSEGESAAMDGSIADIAYQRGDYDEAERICRDVQLPVFERLGDIRACAVTWGQIADIAYERGDYDEAERVCRDVQLPAYQELGDISETAVTWGQIANVAYLRGDYDEAERIRREIELPVYEGLGNAPFAAVAWGKIADIAYMRGDLDEAERIRCDIQLPAFERLGNAHEKTVAWGKIADIAYMRSDYDEAERIRREMTLPAYERLGDRRSVAVTWSGIADIAFQRGDYDQAERIRRDTQLPAFERLGDIRGCAVTWGQIADIAHQRGDLDEAERIRREQVLPVYERLGDTRSVALVWEKIADIAFMRGDLDEAEHIRREMELPIYRRLGDSRLIAVTLSQIAEIAYQRGDFASAAAMHRRRLEDSRQLGDLDGIAAACWGLARIDLTRENFDAAFPRVAEAFEILIRLQRPDGLAAVGWALGQLLVAAGESAEAHEVLITALAAAQEIDETNLADEIKQFLHEHAAPDEQQA